jgi:hypothetical protein
MMIFIGEQLFLVGAHPTRDGALPRNPRQGIDDRNSQARQVIIS